MDSTNNSSEENYVSEDEIVDDNEFYTFVTIAASMANEYYSKYIDKVL